jgi:hypothetical protein
MLLAFNLIVNRPSLESGCVCVCVKVGEKVRKEGRMKVEERAKKGPRRIVEKETQWSIDGGGIEFLSFLLPTSSFFLLPPPQK